MTKEATIARIIEYFKDNEGIFNSCIKELDSYNGYLNDERYYYPMEELNEIYSNTDPLEILRRAFYGHNEDTFTTDSSGNKTYGEFNPKRNYFYYNDYGNLVSSYYIDYSECIEQYAVKAMSENRLYIDTIEDYYDLAALFDELEEADEKV